MLTTLKIQEPIQPTVDLCCVRQPVLKACSIAGLILFITVLPQLVVEAIKACNGTYMFIDLVYSFYILSLLFVVLTMVDSHDTFKSRQSLHVYTFVAKDAKHFVGRVLFWGFLGIAYTTILKLLDAPHFWAPLTGEMDDRSKPIRSTNAPARLNAGFGCMNCCKLMTTEALFYACVQWVWLAYCGILMVSAREYAARHKLYTRLMNLVKFETIA